MIAQIQQIRKKKIFVLLDMGVVGKFSTKTIATLNCFMSTQVDEVSHTLSIDMAPNRIYSIVG